MLVAFVAVAGGLVSGSDGAADITAPELTTNDLWVLIAAAMVFFMQAGFLAFESGIARETHRGAVALKNVMDWTVGSIAFFLVGFGLMYGTSQWGIVGTDLFALDGLLEGITSTVSAPTFFVFQLAFAGTAITIVSGALCERITFTAYMALSLVMGLLVFPVFGHWAWHGLSGTGEEGWLEALGFHDFAGSSVVHSVGGWAALVGAVVVGSRIGRYGPDGRPRPLPPSDIALTGLGTLILWFCWWGFNGGSVLALDGSVVRIIIVTNLAGCASMITAGLHAYVFQDRTGMNTKLLGGALAGLVAVTASADVVDPFGAIAIGVVAGVVHNLVAALLDRMQIDDPLGAVPLHLGCGIWGTLAVALFAPAETLEHDRITQLGVQALGVVVCAVWTVTIVGALMVFLKRRVGVRVSAERELGGLSSWEEGLPATSTERFDDDELEELLR